MRKHKALALVGCSMGLFAAVVVPDCSAGGQRMTRSPDPTPARTSFPPENEPPQRLSHRISLRPRARHPVMNGGCPPMFGGTADFGHKCMRAIYGATGHVPMTV
jgi:hypothetical protein